MEFIPFFLVLLAAVFFSELFRRLHLPWVIALIMAGIVIGPFGLGIFDPGPTFEFLGQMGLVFLMFMAGLEIKLSSFRTFRSSIAWVAVLNGVIPLLVGIGIGMAFGFSMVASLLLGAIFVSSSIAVVVPSLEAGELLESRLGKSIVSATMIDDIASLVILSILLQTINPTTPLPLPLFYIGLFGILVFLRLIIPKVEQWFARGLSEQDMFEQEVRTIFAVLLGTVVLFEVLGLHAIIAGFFAGLVLSETISSEILLARLRAISYGIFIPIFFVIVGTRVDIGVFAAAEPALYLVLAVVIGSIVAKFTSGWVGGLLGGFSSRQSALIGSSTIPQLSTTLAVVFAAAELELLDSSLVTAMIVLSIVTTFAGPLLVRVIGNTLTEREAERIPS